MKKNLFVLLIIMSIFFVFMTVVHSAEIVDSGNCGADGDNVTWTLDDEGVLTISGEGDMKDYYHFYNQSPFYNNSNIKSVIINHGIANIGAYIFHSCDELVNIAIPDSVISIGEFAFCSSGLTSVTLPKNIETVGANAFANCENLESVYISDLQSYLNIDFQNAYSNPMSYAYKLYCNNSRVLGTITIPDGVTKIPAYAFARCDGIKNVVIPDGITEIGSDAFRDCKGLTDITFPNSIQSINYGAFYNCTGLTSISFSGNLTSIGSSAFYNCNKLSSVSIPSLIAWCNIKFDSESSNPMCYADNLYIDGEAANEIEIPKEIKCIGNYTFYHCTGITSVNIPDGVTDIGNYAFCNCTELKNIVIPDSVSIIGAGAFSECSALTSIIIPDNVTSIGEYAFGNAGIITINYNAEKVYPYIFKQDYHFSGNNKMKLVILGDNVSIIDKDAFVGCGKLRKIYISKNVREIEQNAFGSCSDLKVVYFGGSQEEWDEVYVGSDNENLTSAEIIYNSSPADVVISSEDYLSFQIDESDQSVTITGCENTIDKITVPSEYRGYPVTTIGGGAFYNCGNLQEISLPDTITKIQQSAFEYCTGLTSISIPNSVMDIDNYAFMFCRNIVDVKIGSSIKSIGVGTFSECTNLKSITIPKSVMHIDSAFGNCDNLTDVYYTGTKNQWDEIYIDSRNAALLNATLHTAEGTTVIYPYEIQSMTLTDTLGNAISAPKINQSFIIETTFYKKKYRNIEDYFFVAVYGADNTLLSIDYVKANFVEGYTYSVGFNIPPQPQAVGVVKAFVWNTFNSLEPLAEAVEIIPTPLSAKASSNRVTQGSKFDVTVEINPYLANQNGTLEVSTESESEDVLRLISTSEDENNKWTYHYVALDKGKEVIIVTYTLSDGTSYYKKINISVLGSAVGGGGGDSGTGSAIGYLDDYVLSDCLVVTSPAESEYSSVLDETVITFESFNNRTSYDKWYGTNNQSFASVEVGDIIRFMYNKDNIAKEREDIMPISGVLNVLNNTEPANQKLYDWTETVIPTEGNGYQTMKFDYRANVEGDTDAATRVAIFNVSIVDTENNKLYVTNTGFEKDNDNNYVLDDNDYEVISVTEDTKFIRMDEDNTEVTPYVWDTTEYLSINDIKDAKNYGPDCTTIAVIFDKGEAVTILMYEK